ncbi:CPBP family intramembrane metalloprotease [Maribacter algarum]|uniref:CPBP family intramembrane metalloprotease n=1 Tax=Maribacter algarum (ex Zhang et al. 2020) TaxID=2578118 RepID=A0A5S3PK46_9FLAO|nr:type II CAAX endopeptidase family protein [Maribacter algarum]TMM53851.1 CPBP family intramembrane metalloprotease [Maribacter algarum]
MKGYGIVLEAVLILVLVGILEYGAFVLISKYFSNDSSFEIALNLNALTSILGSLIAVFTGLWLWKFKIEWVSKLPSKKIITTALLIVILEFLVSDFFNLRMFFERIQEGKILFFDWSISQFNEFDSYFYFANVILIGPILEELFFRGILFKKFKRVLSVSTAIVLSSALFSLVHLNFQGFAYYFIGGCILGYMYHRTNSLILVMGYHAIFNLLAIVVKRREFYTDDNQFFAILIFFFVCFAGLYLALKRFHLLTISPEEDSSPLDPPEYE